jgi:hypothetical protein
MSRPNSGNQAKGQKGNQYAQNNTSKGSYTGNMIPNMGAAPQQSLQLKKQSSGGQINPHYQQNNQNQIIMPIQPPTIINSNSQAVDPSNSGGATSLTRARSHTSSSTGNLSNSGQNGRDVKNSQGIQQQQQQQYNNPGKKSDNGSNNQQNYQSHNYHNAQQSTPNPAQLRKQHSSTVPMSNQQQYQQMYQHHQQQQQQQQQQYPNNYQHQLQQQQLLQQQQYRQQFQYQHQQQHSMPVPTPPMSTSSSTGRYVLSEHEQTARIQQINAAHNPNYQTPVTCFELSRASSRQLAAERAQEGHHTGGVLFNSLNPGPALSISSTSSANHLSQTNPNHTTSGFSHALKGAHQHGGSGSNLYQLGGGGTPQYGLRSMTQYHTAGLHGLDQQSPVSPGNININQDYGQSYNPNLGSVFQNNGSASASVHSSNPGLRQIPSHVSLSQHGGSTLGGDHHSQPGRFLGRLDHSDDMIPVIDTDFEPIPLAFPVHPRK